MFELDKVRIKLTVTGTVWMQKIGMPTVEVGKVCNGNVRMRRVVTACN